MRYMIRLWDRRTFTVSEKVGKQIMLAKASKIEAIKVRGALYETKAISYIEPINEEPKDTLLPEKVEQPVKKETLEKTKEELKKKFGWN